MALSIHGNVSRKLEDLVDKKYDYDYPEGLDFDPQSPLHKKIITNVIERAMSAKSSISNKFDTWRELDQILTCYKMIDDDEEDLLDEDSRKPVSIIFPYSLAILETWLAYLSGTLLDPPIFRYNGVGAEDEYGAMLMEKIVGLHCHRFSVGANLHTWIRDALVYGFGVAVPSWGIINNRNGIFEGNRLVNVDPYMCLPDPNCPIHEVQQSEFFGWCERTNLMDLLRRERDGEFFNVRYLKHFDTRTSIYSYDESDREINSGRTRPSEYAGVNPVDVIHLYANILPDEWGLGSSEYPEKWYFAIAGDTVVIKAQPMDLDHNMFPVGIASPDFDGYSITPTSKIETLKGLQGVLDWLFNTHIAAVRKAVNNTYVIDPFRVNINDITNPKSKNGGVIRLRRPAWGTDVRNVLMQMPVNDVTDDHINDSSWLVQWMEKISGTDSALMGSLRDNGPERLSSQEFLGTQMGGLTRVDRALKMISIQGMRDLGYLFASHTQQFMTEPMSVRITGDWVEYFAKAYGTAPSHLSVYPDQLSINFDVMIDDASMMQGNQSAVWLKIFEVITQNPQLQQQYDLFKVFEHIAVGAGAKNIDKFRNKNIQPQIMSDDSIVRHVKSGNLQPLERGNGGIQAKEQSQGGGGVQGVGGLPGLFGGIGGLA